MEDNFNHRKWFKDQYLKEAKDEVIAATKDGKIEITKKQMKKLQNGEVVYLSNGSTLSLVKESNRDLYDKVIGDYFEKEDDEMSFDNERNMVKDVIRQAMREMDSNQTLLTRDYIDTIIDRLNDLKMSDF